LLSSLYINLLRLFSLHIWSQCAELLQDSQPGIAPQPVGFDAGVKGAHERINNLRCTRLVSEQQVCVAVESFIVELQSDM